MKIFFNILAGNTEMYSYPKFPITCRKSWTLHKFKIKFMDSSPTKMHRMEILPKSYNITKSIEIPA